MSQELEKIDTFFFINFYWSRSGLGRFFMYLLCYVLIQLLKPDFPAFLEARFRIYTKFWARNCKKVDKCMFFTFLWFKIRVLNHRKLRSFLHIKKMSVFLNETFLHILYVWFESILPWFANIYTPIEPIHICIECD